MLTVLYNQYLHSKILRVLVERLKSLKFIKFLLVAVVCQNVQFFHLHRFMREVAFSCC